jgi:hypothetical protein
MGYPHGKIDNLGFLSIKRKDIWKQQYCMYTENQKCGDWCPLFDGPEIVGDDTYKESYMFLCTFNNFKVFDGDFQDLRT